MKAWMVYVVLAGVTAAALATEGFDRYQIIIDSKPFGEVTAPPPPPPPPINPADSFAANYRMCGLVRNDDGSIKIGLLNTKDNYSFFVSEGESAEGVELVSADYENEKAVLRKGQELVELTLQSGVLRPLNEQEAQQQMSAPKMSYVERRAERQRLRRPPPPVPKYTGEELEKHLLEYQMEVIRQGLPPLPIPLTKEMDDQLVSEGVLPAQE